MERIWKEFLIRNIRLPGILPGQLETGAVIVTGESARKEKAGVFLGEAIQRSRLFRNFSVIPADQTIRATVIGSAAIRHPYRRVRSAMRKSCFLWKMCRRLGFFRRGGALLAGKFWKFEKKAAWFLAQNDTTVTALAVRGKYDPGHKEIKSFNSSYGSDIGARDTATFYYRSRYGKGSGVDAPPWAGGKPSQFMTGYSRLAFIWESCLPAWTWRWIRWSSRRIW